MLNKEFKPRDVQRMRNIISGKAGDGTQTQVGYVTEVVEHVEGDIWEENGKTWTIKRGIKQTISKYGTLRKVLEIPLACPSCKTAMNDHWINVKMFRIHGMCLNCVTEMETNLKVQGKFEDYKKGIMNSNKNAMLEDLEKALDNWVQETDTFISEDGVVEDWSKVSKETEALDNFRDFIKRAKEEEI
jgi:hypothetical protein